MAPRPFRGALTALLGGLALGVLGAGVHAAPVADLRDGPTGRIEFPSVTPTGPTQLVKRSYPPEGTLVVGTLTLPPGAAGRVPAMVVAHGSGGIQPGREDAWAQRLNGLGIATFIVDSFGPRSLRSTATDQSRLSTMANLADALSALRLLATHPRLDPARIGVIGFSRGGQVALYSALEPLRQGVVDGDLRFAAHIALYPSCSIPYRAQHVSGAPILMLLGGADDYTPPAHCRAYGGWLASRGARIRTVVYDGAFHTFDTPRPPRFLRNLQSARACNAAVEVETGTVRLLATDETLRDPAAIRDYFRGCQERGATLGGDPAALRKAEADVAAFLADAFALPH